MTPLYSLNLLIQILLAILSVLYLKKSKSIFIKLLTLFTTATMLIELVGFYFVEKEINSFYYYHVFSLLEFPVIFFIYKGLIKDSYKLKIPKLILAATFIFWSATFVNNNFYNLTIISGSLLVSILVMLYLRDILISDEILNYKKLLPFWVSVGFLIFYLPSIPFFSLLDYMKDRGLFFILIILTILKSIFIIYGLITCSSKNKY